MCSGTVGVFAFSLALKWTAMRSPSVENLDAAGGQARFDLYAGETVGNGVIVGVDIDVVVDADPTHAPLAVFVRLARQRLERRAREYQEFRVWPERLNLFMPLPGVKRSPNRMANWALAS